MKHFSYDGIVVGCDEAGRGCLAGPVFAGAVILPSDYKSKILNDSKKLSAKKRDTLRKEIEKNALGWAVAKVSPYQIDKINILNASIRAMHQAIHKLRPIIPDMILVDGNKFHPYKRISHKCIIKGDGKYFSIAAASILAKTHRDEYMRRIHRKHPIYNWESNKGYPTLHHREVLKEEGPSKYHRMTFKLKPFSTQLELEF